jgi:hypothetical protein
MNKDYKETKSNAFYTLLAVVLIVALWLMWFASIGLLSEICNGDYFWWRTLAMYPFTMVNIKVSGLVWMHYR